MNSFETDAQTTSLSDRSSAAAASRVTGVVISCEHGGREVPDDYKAMFADHAELLETHRGWDPGALELGEQMAAAFDAPLYASTTTRLLVDLNRSVGHRHLHFDVIKGLPRAQRREVVARHYRPHRDAVEGEIARRIAAGERVVHIASHSFTPVLNGVIRRADVAWLYDPRRAAESLLSQRWLSEFAKRTQGLRLRRNYPYQGRGDGLTTLMRKRYSNDVYVGIELEVNQRFVQEGGAPWDALRSNLIESLKAALSLDA